VIFRETKLPGAYVIELEPHRDERGFFARTWCQREFEAHGLNPGLVQCNISYNEDRGTLRGMHYQAPPHEEAKLVRCTRGRLYDVIIDLRPDSPAFKQHIGVTLSAENRTMLYVPEGFAHGFLTLDDATEVFYQMSAFYAPEAARGVRWNDPAFGIEWPAPVEHIKDRDQAYADFKG
jgi:dTDP-4-dehydrorhamnose 3,5-epimerase